jgi:hypothetical protein
MSQNVMVAGVGMIPFTKPGMSLPYDEMGAHAASLALRDAGLDYADVQQAAAGYVYGDSTCGQAALYRHDRHPGVQRQQQLLHRVVRAVPGAADGGFRRH